MFMFFFFFFDRLLFIWKSIKMSLTASSSDGEMKLCEALRLSPQMYRKFLSNKFL